MQEKERLVVVAKFIRYNIYRNKIINKINMFCLVFSLCLVSHVAGAEIAHETLATHPGHNVTLPCHGSDKVVFQGGHASQLNPTRIMHNSCGRGIYPIDWCLSGYRIYIRGTVSSSKIR